MRAKKRLQSGHVSKDYNEMNYQASSFYLSMNFQVSSLNDILTEFIVTERLQCSIRDI